MRERIQSQQLLQPVKKLSKREYLELQLYQPRRYDLAKTEKSSQIHDYEQFDRIVSSSEQSEIDKKVEKDKKKMSFYLSKDSDNISEGGIRASPGASKRLHKQFLSLEKNRVGSGSNISLNLQHIRRAENVEKSARARANRSSKMKSFDGSRAGGLTFGRSFKSSNSPKTTNKVITGFYTKRNGKQYQMQVYRDTTRNSTDAEPPESDMDRSRELNLQNFDKRVMGSRPSLRVIQGYREGLSRILSPPNLHKAATEKVKFKFWSQFKKFYRRD